MNRTAIYFGAWTMACMVTTIVAFYLAADLADGTKNVFSPGNPTWGAIGVLIMFAPVAGVVAGLVWAAFHRGNARRRWITYALIALLVVGISHMLVFGTIATWESEDVLRDLLGAMILFVIHGWLSVPVAFAGTALFVRWARRRALLA
jgi:hypothetical protein